MDLEEMRDPAMFPARERGLQLEGAARGVFEELQGCRVTGLSGRGDDEQQGRWGQGGD